MRLIFMMNHMLACVWWYIGSESYFMSGVYQDQERWVSHYDGFGCAALAQTVPDGGFILREGDSKIGLKTCATLLEQYCVRCVDHVPATQPWPRNHDAFSLMLQGAIDQGLAWRVGCGRACCSHYWVFASLTTNGLVGGMTPRNPLEIAFTCMVMCVSLTVYAYILGEISNLVMKQDEALVATRSSILQVADFVKNRVLPPELEKEIEHYFHFLASNNASSEDEDVFEMLSHTLQVDVAKHISRGLLDNVQLLRDCDATFLDSLSILLRENTTLPDTYVFHVNDVSRELYFVNNGAVELTIESIVEGEETEVRIHPVD
jgi:hypothetical protein